MVRRGGRCEAGGKSRENFLYGSLASAKQEKTPFRPSLLSALRGRERSRTPVSGRGREGQKAPISVAQERQILDVPTLMPGPCVAAPRTGGVAYAGGTGTPAEAGEKRNVAIWLLLDEPSLSAPAGDGILGTAGTAVAEAAPRALRLEEPILPAR